MGFSLPRQDLVQTFHVALLYEVRQGGIHLS